MNVIYVYRLAWSFGVSGSCREVGDPPRQGRPAERVEGAGSKLAQGKGSRPAFVVALGTCTRKKHLKKAIDGRALYEAQQAGARFAPSSPQRGGGGGPPVCTSWAGRRPFAVSSQTRPVLGPTLDRGLNRALAGVRPSRGGSSNRHGLVFSGPQAATACESGRRLSRATRPVEWLGDAEPERGPG